MEKNIKDKAIVLKSTNYKDSDKLLTLFTLRSGKCRASLKGVLKPKAKLAFAGQPFCLGEYILSRRGDFFTVTNCNAVDSFFGITLNIDKFYAASVMLETSDILVKEDEGFADLFVLLLQALKTLCYLPADPKLVLAKFLLDALALAGYKIKCENCVICGARVSQGFFSFALGGFVCPLHAEGDSVGVSSAVISALKNLYALNFDKIVSWKVMNEDIKTGMLKLLVNFFEDKTGERLKSFKYIV